MDFSPQINSYNGTGLEVSKLVSSSSLKKPVEITVPWIWVTGKLLKSHHIKY